jgi:Tol biopolymer transport system component
MRILTLLFWALIFTAPSAELMKIQAAEDKFAYTRRPPNGNMDIYVVDGKGGEPIQLTDDQARDKWPAWSPDGTLLAFISDGRLVVMDAEKNRRNIAAGTFFRPAWSPDGRQIAVMKGLSLWIFDVETREGKEIHGTQVSMSPTWSPDGLQIAFRSDLFAEGNWDIYLMDINIDINPLNPRRLTVDPGDDHYPAWSSDGTELAFSSDRNGKSQIYIMDMIGRKKIRQLTDLPFSGQGPVWSPAGDQIAFGGQEDIDIKSLGIYVADAKGGKPTLRVPTGTSSPPVWAEGPVRFAVDPREKLATTWGAIKKGD